MYLALDWLPGLTHSVSQTRPPVAVGRRIVRVGSESGLEPYRTGTDDTRPGCWQLAAQSNSMIALYRIRAPHAR
jgi:hypothetical protein